MSFKKQFQYSDTYNHTHPRCNAPMIDINVYTPPYNEIALKKSGRVRFCLDTGADYYAAIPEYILFNTGINTGQEIRVEDYKGVTDIEPVYTIGLAIKDLKFNQIVEAIPTKKDYGFLPRSILNQWNIALDGPKEEFSITIDL